MEAASKVVQYRSQQGRGTSIPAGGVEKGLSARAELARVTRKLRRTLQDVRFPQSLYEGVRVSRCFPSFAGAVMMAVAYAYEAAPKDDPFVAKVYHIHSFIVTVLTPEWSALLLAFPFCMSTLL